MKSLEKVILDRSKKIELNNLTIISYISHDKIICKCRKCDYEIIDNHRNLSRKFKCNFCYIFEKSDILKSELSFLLKIEGSKLHLRCKNGHYYIQDRRNLLSGRKCDECRKINRNFTKEDVISEFYKIHMGYFKYNMDGYKTLHSKIKITCENEHTFLQKASNHLQGKGCPICRESYGERYIRKYLESNKIKFERQKKFNDCKFINKLPFDFFLPDYNILIEYDGLQHFKPVKQFGGESEFIKTVKKDKIKTDYCLNNNINLIRISYKDDIKEKLSSINKLVIF